MINCHTEKQNKIKNKKRFAGVTEKYLKTGILKHIWWKVKEKLMFRMLWNTLKDGLCCLPNESVSIVSLLNMHEATDFIWSGQAYRSLNLLCILIFFYENCWSRLTWGSKCRGGVSHGNIKFWFSGNANTVRHCLLLQFQQIESKCIKSDV